MKINLFNNLKLSFSSQKEEPQVLSKFNSKIKDSYTKTPTPAFSANRTKLPIGIMERMFKKYSAKIIQEQDAEKKHQLSERLVSFYDKITKGLDRKIFPDGFLGDLNHEVIGGFFTIKIALIRANKKTNPTPLPNNFKEIMDKELNNIIAIYRKYQFFLDKDLFRSDFPKAKILEYSLNLVKGKTKKLTVEGAELLENANLKIKNPELYSVISNVIGNAAKYSKGEGNVTIKFKKIVNKEGKEFLRFSVTDNGIGIPQKDIAGITKGQRASNTGEINGTGYGLQRVAKIMQHCLSPVKIHSRENIGTQIICDFPFSN